MCTPIYKYIHALRNVQLGLVLGIDKRTAPLSKIINS